MKRRIGQLKRGTVFHYGGEKFVILDNLESGVLVLLEQSSKSVPFNSEDWDNDYPMNEYAHSTLRKEIEGPWIKGLIENGAKYEDMVKFTVNLSQTDMGTGYGIITVLAAPLTLWQYGKYKGIIPPNKNEWWWLVTPWYCRRLSFPYSYHAADAWRVYTNGNCGYGGCSDSLGIRPALVLDSELLVSLDSEDKEETNGECDNGFVDLSCVDTLVLLREVERRLTAQDS